MFMQLPLSWMRWKAHISPHLRTREFLKLFPLAGVAPHWNSPSGIWFRKNVAGASKKGTLGRGYEFHASRSPHFAHFLLELQGVQEFKRCGEKERKDSSRYSNRIKWVHGHRHPTKKIK
jgi:hypothetical protein